MNVIYARQPLRRSIFLAGPTPRSEAVPSWRPDALRILHDLGFDGDVFVPEASDWAPHNSYDEQVEWEWAALSRASTIAVWIPRDLVSMPGFTTNVEVGLMISQKNMLIGAPPKTPKMKYLQSLAEKFGAPFFHDLPALLGAAVQRP